MLETITSHLKWKRYIDDMFSLWDARKEEIDLFILEANRHHTTIKFNQSLLKDEIYVSRLRTEIPNFRKKYSNVEDLTLKWDLIKMEIRGFTIKYSKNKAKKRKSTEIHLQNQKG